MRVLDLSRPIGPGTRVYPGDPRPEFRVIAEIGRDGYYNRLVALHEHIGTHVDAPAHMVPGGATVDSIPASRLVAPALALRFTGKATAEGLVERLKRHGGPAALEGSYLLLDVPEAAVDATVAELLVEHGALGLGVTAMSPDAPPYPVHRTLLSAGLIIIENLALPGELLEKRFTIVIAPLPLQGGSGAPARVYALLQREVQYSASTPSGRERR